jgi:hypothetical protein
LLTFAPFVYFGTAPFHFSTSFNCASVAALTLNLIENEGHVPLKGIKVDSPCNRKMWRTLAATREKQAKVSRAPYFQRSDTNSTSAMNLHRRMTHQTNGPYHWLEKDQLP